MLTTAVTGRAEIARQISKQAEHDLKRSELLTAPFTFIALVIVFGGLVAALLPLSVGVLAVVGTLLILTLLVSLTEVSVFALNLTTALGLGLAIDYSLFVVSRYREELASGASTNVAVGRTMQTAGRTVVFSAGTVMISLASLLLFPVTYLRSFAYAGVAVVFLAAISSVIVLPGDPCGARAARGVVARVQAEAPVGRRVLGAPGRAGDEAPRALRGRRRARCSSCSRSRSSTSTPASSTTGWCPTTSRAVPRPTRSARTSRAARPTRSRS